MDESQWLEHTGIGEALLVGDSCALVDLLGQFGNADVSPSRQRSSEVPTEWNVLSKDSIAQ